MDYETIEFLEENRKKILRHINLLTFFFLLEFFAFFFVLLIYNIDIADLISFSIIPFVFLIVYAIRINRIVLGFEHFVKKHLMDDIIRNIVKDSGELIWENKSYVSKETFRGFLSLYLEDNARNARIEPDDQFSGVYKGTKFNCAEIYFSKRGNNGVNEVVFRGLVIEIELKKKNFSPVIFKRRYIPSPPIISCFEKIRISKPFESRYNVYLEKGEKYPEFPSSFYDFLVSIVKTRISIGFIGNRVVVTYPNNYDMFKLGSFKKRIDDEEQYKKFKDEFKFMLSIIEKLSKYLSESNI